jgi:hypothetical protein
MGLAVAAISWPSTASATATPSCGRALRDFQAQRVLVGHSGRLCAPQTLERT